MSASTNHRAWRRFRRNRRALLGTAFLFAAVTTTVAAGPFTWSWSNVQNLRNAVRHAPTAQVLTPAESFDVALKGSVAQTLPPSIATSFRTAAGWMGYDALGRSVLFRLMCGWLISLAIGLGAAGVSIIIGVGWGTVSAMAGGRVDSVMMRVVDTLYGLPYILFVILLKVVMEGPLTQFFGGNASVADIVILFLAIGSVSWLTMARVIRGQVLSLLSSPFVESARAIGAGPVRIALRHILPNLVGLVVVYATLIIPQAILQESFLSFLGIGVQPPTPSLGRLASDGVEAVNPFVGYWWLIVFPSGALVMTLLALNFIGDGLRDALDPKSEAATLV
jgi:ABC-type dipeptide/oligopeptide/nickel transport system permease subunit